MNTGDGPSAPLVIGGNSAPKAPATSNIPGNRPAPSSKPGPLAQAIGRAAQRAGQGWQKMMHTNGPLHPVGVAAVHALQNAGKSQKAFLPTDFKTGTMQNLASQYGARTIDYNTGGPQHVQHIQPDNVGNIFPSSQHAGTLARQAVDNVGSIFPANQHAGTLARQAVTPTTVPIGNLHATLTSQIHGGGNLPGGGGPTPAGNVGGAGGGGNPAPAGGGSLADFLTQARQLIGAQYAPQLGDLANQFQQDQDVFNQQRNATNSDAQRMADNLRQIYGGLGQQIGDQAQQLGQQYQGTEKNVGDAYQQLQQQLAGDNFGSQDLRALFQGLGQVGGTNANALLQSEGANQTGLLKTEAANAPLQGANRVSQVDVQALQTLRNLSDNLENQLNALQAKRVNINSAEGQQTAALAQKLQQQAAAAQNAYQVQAQKLGLDQQKLDLSKSLGFGKLGIDQQNADTRTQAEKDKVAEDNILNQLRQQGLSLQAQKAASGGNARNPSGMLGMTSVATQDAPNHVSDLLGFFFNNPTTTAALYNGPTGATTLSSSAQTWANQNAARLGMNPGQLYNDLMTMVATFNNKLGNG